jgi:hypothetical protein
MMVSKSGNRVVGVCPGEFDKVEPF